MIFIQHFEFSSISLALMLSAFLAPINALPTSPLAMQGITSGLEPRNAEVEVFSKASSIINNYQHTAKISERDTHHSSTNTECNNGNCVTKTCKDGNCSTSQSSGKNIWDFPPFGRGMPEHMFDGPDWGDAPDMDRFSPPKGGTNYSHSSSESYNCTNGDCVTTRCKDGNCSTTETKGGK